MRRLSVQNAARYQRQIGIFDLHERQALLRPECGADMCADSRLFDPFFDRNGIDPISRCQLIDQSTYLPEDVLVKVDRAALKSALEVRIPFLDHRVVELANSMPVNLKLRGIPPNMCCVVCSKTTCTQTSCARPNEALASP